MNQRQFRNRASFGKRQENVIMMSELIKQVFDVYIPLVDDQQIDFRVRRGENDYIDLQIKARSKDCKPFDAGRFVSMNITEPRDN